MSGGDTRRGPGRAQVTLRAVNAGNWRDCCALAVHDDQRDFVMPVSYYLALCHYGGVWHPLAVYEGEEVVGLVMWAVDPADNSGWIGGLTVDAPRQARGLGRAVVEALCGRLRDEQGCTSAALSCVLENHLAWALYTSLEFAKTGEMEDDEPVARRPL